MKLIGKEVLTKGNQRKAKSIPKALYEHCSYLIAQELYKDPLWQSAHTIGITISAPPEVDTYQIIRKAWDEGKRIVMPKCLPKDRLMDFRVLDRFDQLESVYFGFLNPLNLKQYW